MAAALAVRIKLGSGDRACGRAFVGPGGWRYGERDDPVTDHGDEDGNE